MPIAQNPETGETLFLTPEGQWEKAQLAENPQTGERMAYDGQAWVTLGAKAETVENNLPDDRSAGIRAIRGAGQVAGGFADSALEAIGSIPDAVSLGLRKVGLPSPEDHRFYTEALKSGYLAAGDALTAPVRPMLPDAGTMAPESDVEKALYGAGRGAGDAAAMMVPGAAVGKMAKAGSATQGVGRMLASQPIMQGMAGATGGAVGQATDNPYLGIAAAMATPYAMGAARRAITPIKNQLSGEQRRLAELLESNGVELTAAQKTGSKPLQYMESVFGDLPLTSGPQSQIASGQRAAFNRMALQKAGINADNAAPEVLDDAFRSIGRRFDDLASQTTVKADKTLFDDIERTAENYARRLPTDIKPVFRSYVDDIMGMRDAMRQTGSVAEIDGQSYQNVASGLRKAARGAKSNPDLQSALNGLVDSLDDVMIRSTSPELGAAWKSTRREYRNLLTIDDAMSRGTQVDRSSADIPLSGLRIAVKAKDASGYSRGRGDLNDISRAGEFLGAAQPPNSGTATRSLITNALTYGPSGALLTGDPVLAAGGLTGTLLGPRLAQKAYNSNLVRGYLTNQLLHSPVNNPALQAKIGIAQSRGPLVDALLGN